MERAFLFRISSFIYNDKRLGGRSKLFRVGFGLLHIDQSVIKQMFLLSVISYCSNSDRKGWKKI